jgi:hypothetical protein
MRKVARAELLNVRSAPTLVGGGLGPMFMKRVIRSQRLGSVAQKSLSRESAVALRGQRENGVVRVATFVAQVIGLCRNPRAASAPLHRLKYERRPRFL